MLTPSTGKKCVYLTSLSIISRIHQKRSMALFVVVWHSCCVPLTHYASYIMPSFGIDVDDMKQTSLVIPPEETWKLKIQDWNTSKILIRTSNTSKCNECSYKRYKLIFWWLIHLFTILLLSGGATLLATLRWSSLHSLSPQGHCDVTRQGWQGAVWRMFIHGFSPLALLQRSLAREAGHF